MNICGWAEEILYMTRGIVTEVIPNISCKEVREVPAGTSNISTGTPLRLRETLRERKIKKLTVCERQSK